MMRGRAGVSRSGFERGSAVVEFALVLPMVLFVLLALVQVGVLAHDRLILTQASRAGAREAAVQSSDASVESAARAAAASLDPARLSVSIVRSGTRGSPVTVTLTYDAPTASVLAGWLLPASVALRADATMRQEFG